jgi:hypothetical protein
MIYIFNYNLKIYFFTLENSLPDLFQNFSLKTTISSYPARSFTLYGFGLIDDANETYYALDHINSTHCNFVLYDRNWTYLTYKTMPIYVPYSIISINNELFITAYNGIYKSDKYLNLVKSYTRISADYTRIYHNHTTDILYVASYGSNRLDLFYRNLSFISSISLTNQPYALTEKNGKLYIGFDGGVVSVLENDFVINNITTLCTSTISSIVIDSNELMGVLCLHNNMLYLYMTNGTYTGKSMTTPTTARFMNYDLNGHFIITGYCLINLYY